MKNCQVALMKSFSFLIMLVCLASFAAQASENLEIYVRNRLLQGGMLRSGREIYVPAKEFRDLIRENLSWDDSTGIIMIDGKATALKLMRQKDISYLPLRATAQALGYETAENEGTGILDVYKKTAPKQDEKKTAAPATTIAAGADKDVTPQTASAADDKEKKDLLTIKEKGVQQDYLGSPEGTTMVNSPHAGTHTTADSGSTDLGIRITAVITNGRPTEARNVVATCTLKTQDGEVFTKDDRPAGNIKAGEKTEVLFFFPSVSGGIILQRSFTVKSD